MKKKPELAVTGLSKGKGKFDVKFDKNKSANEYEFVIFNAATKEEEGRSTTKKTTIDLAALKDSPGDKIIQVMASDDERDGVPARASFTVSESGVTAFALLPAEEPVAQDKSAEKRQETPPQPATEAPKPAVPQPAKRVVISDFVLLPDQFASTFKMDSPGDVRIRLLEQSDQNQPIETFNEVGEFERVARIALQDLKPRDRRTNRLKLTPVDATDDTKEIGDTVEIVFHIIGAKCIEGEMPKQAPANQPAPAAAPKRPEERVDNPETLRHIQHQAGHATGAAQEAPAATATEIRTARPQRAWVMPAWANTRTLKNVLGVLLGTLLICVLAVGLYKLIRWPGPKGNLPMSNAPATNAVNVVELEKSSPAVLLADPPLDQRGTIVAIQSTNSRVIPTVYMDEPEAPKIQTCSVNNGGMSQNSQDSILITGNSNTTIIGPLIVHNQGRGDSTNAAVNVPQQGQVSFDSGQQYYPDAPMVYVNSGGVCVSDGYYGRSGRVVVCNPFGSPIGNRYQYCLPSGGSRNSGGYRGGGGGGGSHGGGGHH